MRDLVIDTATERLLLGYRSQNDELRIGNWASQGNHAQEILPRLAELLEGEMPERIGVALGPGSFTGLRIGVSTAKGLAEGWQCPVWGLESLQAMARTASGLYPRAQEGLLVAIDARKGRFYGSLWQQDRALISTSDWEPARWLQEIQALGLSEVLVTGYQGQLLSSHWSQTSALWRSVPLDDWTPALMDQLQHRAQSQPPMDPAAGPEYLRLSEAQELRALSEGRTATPAKK